MLARFLEFLRDEDGVTAVEYALLLVLVAVAAIAVWHVLGLAVAVKANGVTATLK